MAQENVQWLPLESNPEAMNKFLRTIGIPEPTQCVDVLGFDADLVAMLPQPIYAVIFCFPDYRKFEAQFKPIYDKLAAEGAKVPEGVFFMEQTIGNACGTFAIFHALANNADKINLGNGTFKGFLEKAKTVDPKERSSLLATNSSLATAHEGCAQAGDTVAEHENVEHHFICYVNKNGQLLEIGGVLFSLITFLLAAYFLCSRLGDRFDICVCWEIRS
uniref:Ubiquitin carboxyl-terminal hydrolase n=1 Tax=Plectus sambesii TaxID=2011161 RepID=A0A914X6C1_9BILA